MQDRVSLYPGRVKLIPVSGNENTYDMVRSDEPTQEGDPLSKATFLKDATSALYGLGTDAVPDDVLSVIPSIINNSWNKIQSYETAGTYTFIVPDLFGGKSYKLGYMVIGGGGGGSAISLEGSTYGGATGGCSGFSTYGIIRVTPGESKTAVVGTGGSGKTTSGGKSFGTNGGSSSFDGNIANGGSAGNIRYISSSSSNDYVFPGVGGQKSHAVSGYTVLNDDIEPFGGTVIFNVANTGNNNYIFDSSCSDILSCFNPFEMKRILSAGGSAAGVSASSYHGDRSDGGRGAGDGAASSRSATATSATVTGCGGGSAVAGYGTAISGSGAAGAVYLYVLGGQ